jgi:hypothetical protein
MARKYQLRNGATVEVAPGQDMQHSVGVVYDGRVEYLLYPPTEEGETKPLPKGGVLGEGFDAIAMDDPIDLKALFLHSTPGIEPLRVGRVSSDLLDAIRYAAGFTDSMQQGEIDLMSTNQNAFTTIEYYHGSPCEQMSDDQIFGYVRNIDAKLKELNGLGDGKAVTAHTVRLETEKEGLLRVVDARYEKNDTDSGE